MLPRVILVVLFKLSMNNLAACRYATHLLSSLPLIKSFFPTLIIASFVKASFFVVGSVSFFQFVQIVLLFLKKDICLNVYNLRSTHVDNVLM